MGSAYPTFDNIPPDVGIVKPDDQKDILLPGEFGAVFDFVVFDSKTKEIAVKKAMKSHSFLLQFMQLLVIQWAGLTIPTNIAAYVRDITNTLQTPNSPYQYTSSIFNATSGVGNVSSGIIIGTGNTAPTITDYVIQTIIAHGGGAGQMNYGATSFGSQASDATTSQFTITRNFSNASGGSITVNELALYVVSATTSGTASFCIIHDVIAGGITVPNGQTLTINYRPQCVV